MYRGISDIILVERISSLIKRCLDINLVFFVNLSIYDFILFSDYIYVIIYILIFIY